MPLVVIEGIDGSGKSGLTKAVVERLGGVRYAYPSDGAVGKLIRATFSGSTKIAPEAMQHLFVADAIDGDASIAERVSLGELVVLDRHPLVSGWVYGVEHLPLDLIQALSIGSWFTPADLVVILDLPAEVARGRLLERGGLDQGYEQAAVSVMEARRRRYLAYSTMHTRVLVLDAQLPLTQNAAIVARALRSRKLADN